MPPIDADPNPAPTSPPAEPPGDPNPTPDPVSTPKVSTEPGQSPSAEPKAGDDPAGDPKPDPKPDPAPDPQAEAAAAARAAVPEAADGYAFNLSEKGKAVWGDVADDPAIKAIREHAHAAGKPQGYIDDVTEVMNVLAEKGLLEPPFDPAAELAKLGEGGEARRTEAELFAQAWKARGDLDDEEFGELMSLTPTAAGVRLVEKLRKSMVNAPAIKADMPAAQGAAQPGDTPAQAEARAMARDERYGKDKAFTREADRKFQEAFSSKGG